MPFDTTSALQRQSLAPPAERPSKVKGDAPPWDDPPPRQPIAIQPLPSDTFSHARHKKLACLTCHRTQTGHGLLTFEAPRGCQICHHQAPGKSTCTACHEQGSVPDTLTARLTVQVGDKPAHTRPVPFRHEAHDSLTCVSCHSQPVSLQPVDSTVTCSGCHATHHKAGRDCATCHRSVAASTEVHARATRTHLACDDCHATRAITELTPTRTFCLACHEASVDHYRDRECSTCHLQAHPEQYRPALLKRERAG
jgi:hypothetical protein